MSTLDAWNLRARAGVLRPCQPGGFLNGILAGGGRASGNHEDGIVGVVGEPFWLAFLAARVRVPLGFVVLDGLDVGVVGVGRRGRCLIAGGKCERKRGGGAKCCVTFNCSILMSGFFLTGPRLAERAPCGVPAIAPGAGLMKGGAAGVVSAGQGSFSRKRRNHTA